MKSQTPKFFKDINFKLALVHVMATWGAVQQA